MIGGIMMTNKKALSIIVLIVICSLLLFGCSQDPDNNERDELTIDTIKESISGSLGEGEEFTNIELDGDNVILHVNLNHQKDDILPESELAYSRSSSITDNLLELKGWSSVKIIFEEFGEVKLNYDQHESNETGAPYFDYLLIEDRFKEY